MDIMHGWMGRKQEKTAYDLLTEAIEMADYLSKNCRKLSREELHKKNQALIDKVVEARNASTAEDMERIDNTASQIETLIAGIGQGSV